MLHARVKAKVIHWAFPFRQGRVMSTLYDHIKILILHLWRSEMLNMPETVWTCDFTTSYTAHFKNACRREPKRPQTLVGQQTWRSLILLTAKLRVSSILIRAWVERFPGQAQIRPYVSSGLQGTAPEADEYQFGSLRAKDNIDTMCTSVVTCSSHTAKLTAGHHRHT